MNIDVFSQAVNERLGHYVYTLADPATHKIFYVGKGTGNRVFAHAKTILGSLTSLTRLPGTTWAGAGV